MKIYLANATSFRDADVRVACRVALQQTPWPRSRPIYIGCWVRPPRSKRFRVDGRLQVGAAVWVPSTAALWQLAESVRYAVMLRLGYSNDAAMFEGEGKRLPAWCAEAGLTKPWSSRRVKGSQEARNKRALAKSKAAHQVVKRHNQAAAEARRGLAAARELAHGLEQLEQLRGQAPGHERAGR